MALLDQLKTYVATATGDPGRQTEQQAEALAASGDFYLDSGGTLCVRAHAASASHVRESALPTRISADANTLLSSLRELVDAGLMTGAGLVLHETDAGVTVEVIS